MWAELRGFYALIAGLVLILAGSAATAQRQPSQEDFANRGYSADFGHHPGWYFAQHKKLSAELAALKPQRPGVVDAYVIAIGMDTDPVFGREAAEASRVLAKRFDAEGRTILLAAGSGAADVRIANGSPQNLSVALGAIAATMDTKEDVLILYSTSHGGPKIGLAYQEGEDGTGMIGPKRLETLVKGLGFTRRMIILSACYAGQFVPVLKDENSVVITASSSDTTSFGCAATNDWTFFGDALINNALREPQPLAEAVGKAFALVAQWEWLKNLPASAPQFSIGSKAAAWLVPLEARMPKTTSAKVGKPSIEG